MGAKMNRKLSEKVNYLINEMPRLNKSFNEWGYKKGPDLYFYKRTMSEIKKNKLENLLKSKEFIELIYATLVSWDMNSRRARIKYFDEFFKNIIENKENFLDLSVFSLDAIPDDKLVEIKSKLKYLYSRSALMTSQGKLVSNSKTMHFILPNLIMPMDRANTLTFFYENTNESENKFLEIFECSRHIAKSVDLTKYLDDEWNQTIPKTIDNAIMFEMKEQKQGSSLK